MVNLSDDNNKTETAIRWTFKYSGYPRPSFNWVFRTYKRHILGSTDVYQDNSQYDVDAKLITFTLKQPYSMDVGEYRLVANNGFQSIEKTFIYVENGALNLGRAFLRFRMN